MPRHGTGCIEHAGLCFTLFCNACYAAGQLPNLCHAGIRDSNLPHRLPLPCHPGTGREEFGPGRSTGNQRRRSIVLAASWGPCAVGQSNYLFCLLLFLCFWLHLSSTLSLSLHPGSMINDSMSTASFPRWTTVLPSFGSRTNLWLKAP